MWICLCLSRAGVLAGAFDDEVAHEGYCRLRICCRFAENVVRKLVTNEVLPQHKKRFLETFYFPVHRSWNWQHLTSRPEGQGLYSFLNFDMLCRLL